MIQAITERALSLAAKRKVKDSEAKQRLSQAQQLPKRGERICATSSETAAVWAKAVQALPSNTLKFALNATHDSLPHNVNLHMWKKRVHCVEKGRVYCMFSTTTVCQETSDATTTIMMQCCERS